MKKEIKRMDPVRTGIVSAVFYALITIPLLLLYVPFIGIAIASSGLEEVPILGGSLIAIFIIAPILYGIFGFIFGILSAWIYNLVAKWTGGYLITVVDAVEY